MDPNHPKVATYRETSRYLTEVTDEEWLVIMPHLPSAIARVDRALGPATGIAPHRIVATVIAAPAQFLEDPDQRQLLACSLRRIARQQLVDLCCPSSEFRSRLDLTLVFEGRLARPQNLADCIPGYPQVPGNLLDRQPLRKCSSRIRPIVSTVSIPPPLALTESRRIRPTCRGSILDANPPAQGVKIARRITAEMCGWPLGLLPADRPSSL